ncbi:MAG: response regulator, partial [Bradymonadaceae bacterium]
MVQKVTDRRVLIVDDHPEMVDLLASRLRDKDWTVVSATGGREAIAKMDRALPDVVVTDLKMEETDGMDVMNQALRRDPDLPVIVITAFGDIESAVDAIKAGGFHYMSKPFDFDELYVYLERALEHR